MIWGLSVYIAVILFLGLSIHQAIKFARMPLHGRMELYPVPQEKGRHTYGGSYMEESEWWSKPHQISKISEIVCMLKEMLFIKKLFNNQRSLWWSSYLFHLGIYIIIVWAVLLIAGALTELAGVSVSVPASAWTGILYYLTMFTGVAGFTVTTASLFLLIVRRVADPTFKMYTTPQEYFNLILLLATAVSGIVVWTPDLTFAGARQTAADLLTLSVTANAAMIIHVILLDMTLIYIPLSKMGHYIGKYFTFHKVLWENEPNIPGSPMEHKVKTALENNRSAITWSAAHMRPPSEQESKS